MKTKTEYLNEKNYISEVIEAAIDKGTQLEELCAYLLEYYLVSENDEYDYEYYLARNQIKRYRKDV